jgi:hypothetical protein
VEDRDELASSVNQQDVGRNKPERQRHADTREQHFGGFSHISPTETCAIARRKAPPAHLELIRRTPRLAAALDPQDPQAANDSQFIDLYGESLIRLCPEYAQ